MALDTVKKIINKISNKNVNNIAIVMHNKPDGDSIGSAVALESALKAVGKKKVDLIIHDKINKKFSPIVGEGRVDKLFKTNTWIKYDILFMIDFSNPNRTFYGVKKIAKYVIVIDHHIYNNPFGDIFFCENVAATAILVYQIIKGLAPITPSMATALYLAIRSDTSSFKNPNTDYLAHQVASKLINLGANIDIINNIYDSRSKEFVQLIGKTLPYVEYDEKYKIAYLVVFRKTIKSSGVIDEEVSLLVDHIRGIENIDIAYLFVEGFNNVRISARSRFTPVNEILSFFGGGGHAKASGCAIDSEDVLCVKEKILQKTREFIDSRN